MTPEQQRGLEIAARSTIVGEPARAALGELRTLRAALQGFRDAFANCGETTSLHEWNQRLKAADAVAAAALGSSVHQSFRDEGKSE
jgi:hypothetical protein